MFCVFNHETLKGNFWLPHSQPPFLSHDFCWTYSSKSGFFFSQWLFDLMLHLGVLRLSRNPRRLRGKPTSRGFHGKKHHQSSPSPTIGWCNTNFPAVSKKNTHTHTHRNIYQHLPDAGSNGYRYRALFNNIPRTSGTSGGEARSLMRTWWETSVRMGISMATLTPENHLQEREVLHLPNLLDVGFHVLIFRGVFGSKIWGGGATSNTFKIIVTWWFGFRFGWKGWLLGNAQSQTTNLLIRWCL